MAKVPNWSKLTTTTPAYFLGHSLTTFSRVPPYLVWNLVIGVNQGILFTFQYHPDWAYNWGSWSPRYYRVNYRVCKKIILKIDQISENIVLAPCTLILIYWKSTSLKSDDCTNVHLWQRYALVSRILIIKSLISW